MFPLKNLVPKELTNLFAWLVFSLPWRWSQWNLSILGFLHPEAECILKIIIHITLKHTVGLLDNTKHNHLTHWGWDKMANIFQTTFSNAFSWKENVWIAIKISLKFVPRGLINNIPASVQIMAWRRPGDKPLSEPMLVSPLTHICISWPQWVKKIKIKKN